MTENVRYMESHSETKPFNLPMQLVNIFYTYLYI